MRTDPETGEMWTRYVDPTGKPVPPPKHSLRYKLVKMLGGRTPYDDDDFDAKENDGVKKPWEEKRN